MIQYSYLNLFDHYYTYQIEKDKLKKAEYDENKGELTIYGKINFLNFFQKDVRDILKEAGFNNINEIK